MKINKYLKKIATYVIAVNISLVAVLPAEPVTAAQYSNRSFSMSNSTPGATGVVYALTITMQTPAKSMIVEFCAESAAIGGTCTPPTGMNLNTSSYSGSSFGTGSPSGSGGPGAQAVNFTIGGTTAYQTTINSSTATTAATKYTFYFTNMSNPSTTGTFYARVYTYANSTLGTYASSLLPGNYIDYGGFALSTASTVTIGATVMETMTFCVSGTSVTSCASATAATVTLGAGSPTALGSALSTANAYTLTSTNAVNGAIISMKNTNSSCGGLSRTAGVSCDIGPAGATAIVIAAGAGLFGANIANSTGGTGATVTAISPYDQSGANKYAMDITAGIGVTSTFGDFVASSSGAVSLAQNILTFAANASPTTPAGVYNANMILIATGTF